MNVGVVHRLTGYDRSSELLAIERDIPPGDFQRAKEIAGVDPDDPEAIGSYPLDEKQAAKMALLLGARIDVTKYDFFLEPFAEP